MNKSEMRVDTLAQLYIYDRRGLVSAAKLEYYKRVLQLFCKSCGEYSIAEVTPGIVRRWLDKQASWKSSTKRIAAKVVSQFLNFAVIAADL